MTETRFVTYKDFSKGEWGELGEFRALPGMFSGSNVVLYNNGMLGPRMGLHENLYSGASMVGRVRGLWLIGAIGKPLMINVDDRIYASTEDNFSLGTVSHVGTIDEVPTDFIRATWYDPNGDIYFTNPGNRTYAFNWTTNTLMELTVRNGGTESAGVETVYLAGDRLYAAGDGRSFGAGGQYVYVSAAADFTNFSGGETFQVGYFHSVRSIIESQNCLLFSTLQSTNAIGSSLGWYSLVGATPQGDLRRVNTTVPSEGQSEVVNAEGGNFYYWTGFGTQEEDNPYLVQANGAKFDDQSFKHLRLGGANRFGYYQASDQTLIYVNDTDSTGYMRCNGAWSKIDFEVNVAGPVCPTESADSFLLAEGGVGETVLVYEMPSRPNHPGFAGAVNANPGDNSNSPLNAYFSLPAFQSDTKEVRVRRVLVDFNKWNTGHADTNNEFTVLVRTFGQYNLPGVGSDSSVATTATWSENQSLATVLPEGELDRFTARIGQQGFAPAFQISIVGMKGVAIESVTVEYDETDAVLGRTV